jgi:phosphatidylserine decarboxylase
LAYRAFARAVGAQTEDAELGLAEYPSLGAFFARRLRDGLRPIDPRPNVIVAPCDGVVAASGTVARGTLVQAKGRTYTLAGLLADRELATQFDGGSYCTIYLSPRDYHRVHAPCAGELVRYDYLPGALWPVAPQIANRRDGLLARNERVVIRMNSPTLGNVAIVMIGAAGVGSIALAHAPPRWPTARALRRGREPRSLELAQPLERGAELGAFRLGSTVVLAFVRGAVALADTVAQQAALQFGAAIGHEGRR